MAIQERLSLVVSMALTGLALYFIIDLPARVVSLPGTDIRFLASTRLLMATLLGALAFTGAGAVVHGHPHRRAGYTTPFWVNPMLIVVFATLTLAQLGSVTAWGVGLGATGVLLWVALLAEYRIAGESGSRVAQTTARFGAQVLSYALMLAYATLIYQTELSLGGRLVGLGLVAGLSAASILRLAAPARTAIWLYAGLVAAGIVQMAWAIAFWPINAVGAALVVLVALYGLSGVIAAHLRGDLSRRVLVEYAVVAGIGLALGGWLGGL